MLLFIKDYQPFTVVEDCGFKRFVEALNPSYQLPSRRTITSTFLPAIYDDVYNKTKQVITSVSAVTLIKDCCTSRNVESVLGVTAHFISEDFAVKSVLLGCEALPESHTSENLVSENKKVIQEWELENKITLVISDIAVNIKRAIKYVLKLNHYSCFTHTLNLVVNDVINQQPVQDTINKIKTIVAHFKRSTLDMAKLMKQQKQLNKEPLKVIMNVCTWWNSTYYMLERFCELEEPIRAKVALSNHSLPIVSVEEWKFLKEFVHVLKPWENVTKVVSGENYVTASVIQVLVQGLHDVYSSMKDKLNFP